MFYTFIVTTVKCLIKNISTWKFGGFYLCELCFKTLWLGEKPENVMALNDLASQTFKEPFSNSNSLRNFKNLLFGNVLSVQRQLYLLCWRSKSSRKKTQHPKLSKGAKQSQILFTDLNN